MKFVVVAILCFLGTGCSGGVSPVMEYNAALEALDRDLKYEKDMERILGETKSESDKKECQDILRGVRENIDRLRRKVKESGPKI